MARFHVIAAVLAAVLVVAFAEESVYDVRPDAIHAFIGNEKIEICGCGFTKYNSVVCIFNGQWMSTNSWIVDDNTVICQAPAFPKEYFFDNLPQDFSVHVVYDNDDNSAIYVGNIRVGPQLNIEGEQVSPQYSRRAGGGTLTISGSLFADNWDSPPTVYFDNVAVNVSTTGYTDTTISVAIPAGKLNQNARISLRFYAGGYTFYLAVDDTLRYGPFITGITETCVDPYGGTTLTVTGQNLDDTASGNDGTRPLIIVSYEQDKDVPFSSANPSFNFQISLLGSTPSATQFTFDAPDVVQAISDASGSPSNDYVSAWGLYVSVDVYFDQSWARSTAETGEPLYILDDPYLIDQIGDLEPQTIGFRYGGYVIHSNGLTIQGTKASTPSASSSFAHYGGEDPICIQFCGVDFVDFDSTNGAEWTFYYDNQDICDTSITRNGDTFCCNTDVFSGDVCDANVQFSASLKLPTSSTEGSGVSFDLENPELSNVWADEEYTAEQWQLTVGPVQISNQFNIIGVSASASVQYSVYAANYARTTSTEWTTRNAVYVSADGQSLTPSGPTQFTHTDTTVSVTYPSYFFDVTNLVNFQFNNKVCVENYVHWGPLCGPWYLQKDSGKPYTTEEFDNFDIDNLGLSSRYVGLNSGSVSISSDYGQSNTGFSTQVVLCERGSFPVTTANENPFLWDTPDSRFDDNNGGSNSPDSCTVFQVSASGANSAQLPTNNNQFLWGEQYDVFMYFILDNDGSGTDQVSANYNSNFASEISIGATTYTARTRCGRIRVGCTADGASCSSPYGPSQGFYELNADGSSPEDAVAGPVGTIGSVEVTGLFMDNPSAPEVALVGYSSSKTLNGGSAGLTAGTQWNKETLEHADSNVNVVCDICNVTDPATTFRIRYGPEILYMDIEENNQGQGDEGDLTYDLWGASCVTDYNSYLTIYGYRFSDYIVGQDGMYANSNSDLSASYPANQLYITVFVDGVQANIDELVVPQSVNEVQELGVYLPTRPFGTAAVVKVYFGKQHYHAEELRYGYASNWNHYLVADQKVHYTPLILDAQVTSADDSTTAIWGYAASAHGLETITVSGLGFFEPYNANVYCYLDDYVVKGDVTADDTVECYFKFTPIAKKRMDIIPNAGEYQVPDNYFFKYGAEFNTNVTFHLEIQDGEVEDLQYLPTTSYGYILDGNENDDSDVLSWTYGEVTNELGVHDIKISGDQLPLFHWGPVCNSLTDSVQFWTTESDIDSANVDLGGYYLQDCLSELTPDNTDYRTPWTLGDADVVDTYCQARNVSIYMVWDDNSGATRTYTLRSQQDSLQIETWQFDNGELTPENIAANSVLNNGNTGTTISNIPCDFEGWFYIYYHDAHATNNFQRNIYCSEPYVIAQPTWEVTADTGTGPTGYGLADDLDDLPWLFGWIGNEIVTTFSYNVENSEYLGAASCIFSHDSTPVTPTVNNNEVSCALPSGNWQETGTLTIRFTGSDDTELARCDHLVAKYTYGPGVLDQEHCDDPFDIDCSEADIQFTAYGPTCCDLATSSHVIFGAGYNPGVSTWSAWSSSTLAAQTLTVPIPGASGFTDCDTASTGLTARQSVPLSSLGPIGIAFYDNIADKKTLSSMNDCTANSNVVDCLFTTVDGSGFNQVCFGPSGNSFVREVRYTYGLQNDEETWVDDTTGGDVHADAFTAGFAGVTNSWDGYDAVFVDFCKGSTCDDRLTDDASLGTSSITVNLREAMYADSSPAGSNQFMVKCGDAYNSVRFRVQLDSNSSPKTVLEDFAVFTSVSGSSPSFLAQIGDEYRVTLDHSPKIKTAVASCVYDQTVTTNNPLACTNLDSTTGFRASEYGLLMIDVTLSNLYDFYQPTETDFSTYNFGKFGVIGFLGSEDGSNIVSRASVGSLNGNDEEYLSYTAENFAQEDYDDFVLLAGDIGGVATTSNGHVTLRFVVPPGEFNSELFFHAHYNPHIDVFTSTDGDQFLWVPYVTAVSKTWVIPRGHENLAYQGHGFTGSEQQEEDVHHTVLQVSNSFRTGVELQASCRIYTDNYITCLTPAFSTPSTTQSADIQFTRCDDDVCDNAWFIPSNQPIDIVGTVAIAPQTISNDGGTVVYFPFYGMSHFATEQIFCGFPDLQSVDHEWLFPVVLNSSNVAFNKPVYECFIPDIQGLTVNNATVITTLNLYFQEPNVPKCDDVDQPFLVTLSTHPVQVGFPCAREAEFTPAANNHDDNTYSGVGVVVVPNLRNKNGVVSVRGDFFPEVNGTTGAASPVDFRCRFEYYNWRAYYDPENRDNGNHYHYRNVLSDLASGPNTYTLVVNGAVEVYAEQWDCTLPESNGDDRDFDVIVVTAVYRGLEDDNCHVVLLNSAAAFASSLVVLLVALAALF